MGGNCAGGNCLGGYCLRPIERKQIQDMDKNIMPQMPKGVRGGGIR
jgi:hypothetical protein